MDSKNIVKNVLKFAAIVLGVFILAQAVSAKSYSFNLSYSNGDCSYCAVNYSYSDRYSQPSYYSDNYYSSSYYSTPSYYSDSYYSPSYYSTPSYYYPTYTAVYTPTYYSNAAISYNNQRPPLTTYGTYYADSIGGYPYAATYNTYSPYQTNYNYGYYSPYYYN